MSDLDMLDADGVVGFDPMDLVKSLPGVLQQTGQALSQKPGEKKASGSEKSETKPSAPAASTGIGLGWKIGGGAAAALIVLHLLRR